MLIHHTGIYAQIYTHGLVFLFTHTHIAELRQLKKRSHEEDRTLKNEIDATHELQQHIRAKVDRKTGEHFLQNAEKS